MLGYVKTIYSTPDPHLYNHNILLRLVQFFNVWSNFITFVISIDQKFCSGDMEFYD